MGRHAGINGLTTEYWWDDVEDKLFINRVDDIEAILNNNVKEYNSHSTKTSKKFHHEVLNKVASIPLVIVEKWRKEEGLDVFNKDHADRVKRKLNDPEYRYLRTSPWRV